MDTSSSVPPHIQPPMAQVPSATRELTRFVRGISMYSSMLSFLSAYLKNRCVLAMPLRIGVGAVLAARAHRIVLRLDQPWIASAHCRWNPDERAFPFAESRLRNLAPPLRPIASH